MGASVTQFGIGVIVVPTAPETQAIGPLTGPTSDQAGWREHAYESAYGPSIVRLPPKNQLLSKNALLAVTLTAMFSFIAYLVVEIHHFLRNNASLMGQA